MNDLENAADPSRTTSNSVIPLVSPYILIKLDIPINDVILIPLELIRSNSDAVRKAREAHLYTKNTNTTKNSYTCFSLF